MTRDAAAVIIALTASGFLTVILCLIVTFHGGRR